MHCVQYSWDYLHALGQAIHLHLHAINAALCRCCITWPSKNLAAGWCSRQAAEYVYFALGIVACLGLVFAVLTHCQFAASFFTAVLLVLVVVFTLIALILFAIASIGNDGCAALGVCFNSGHASCVSCQPSCMLTLLAGLPCIPVCCACPCFLACSVGNDALSACASMLAGSCPNHARLIQSGCMQPGSCLGAAGAPTLRGSLSKRFPPLLLTPAPRARRSPLLTTTCTIKAGAFLPWRRRLQGSTLQTFSCRSTAPETRPSRFAHCPATCDILSQPAQVLMSSYLWDDPAQHAALKRQQFGIQVTGYRLQQKECQSCRGW